KRQAIRLSPGCKPIAKSNHALSNRCLLRVRKLWSFHSLDECAKFCTENVKDKGNQCWFGESAQKSACLNRGAVRVVSFTVHESKNGPLVVRKYIFSKDMGRWVTWPSPLHQSPSACKQKLNIDVLCRQPDHQSRLCSCNID